MRIKNILNDKKLEIVSKDKHLFDKGYVFNVYSIIKHLNKLYIVSKYRTLSGKESVVSFEIKNLYTVYINSDGSEDLVENFIEIGNSLRGRYSNGFKFDIPNIISIEELAVTEQDILYIEKGEY